MQEKYDLIVIGGGPGGYEAAIEAVQHGMHVALVEARDMGGTCLNRGCIPTKTLLHASQMYQEMSGSEEFGIAASHVSYDIQKMYARKEEVVLQLRKGVEMLMKTNKITVINGRAMITSTRTVYVELRTGGSSEMEADKILIATGSAPARPSIEGLTLPGVITSDEILEQPECVSKKLTIIGGGVIGVEFATIFNALGLEVTILEAMERILPTMDREISQNLNMIMKKRGVNIYPASAVVRIEQSENGLVCHFNQKGKEESVISEAVLVAIGRRANIEGLFADDISLKCERGIVVTEKFETSIPGIYAIGDVIHGGIQLAHVAAAQGKSAVAYMAGKTPDIDLTIVPSCIYTNPEIASVGITADEAKALGIRVKSGKFGMTANGKSLIEKQDRGFIKLVFDAESEVLLGAQLMCARATDLISELSVAIVNKLTIHQLSAVIRPHPTFTEGVTEAARAARIK